MPHLHLEYSDNIQQLETRSLMLAIHQALFNAGYINDPNDLKSRAIAQQDYVIGLEQETDQAYVHAKVSLLTGRSLDIRQAISKLILQVMQQHIASQPGLKIQLCVEILKWTKKLTLKLLFEFLD